jgi:hypothetical protein
LTASPSTVDRFSFSGDCAMRANTCGRSVSEGPTGTGRGRGRGRDTGTSARTDIYTGAERAGDLDGREAGDLVGEAVLEEAEGVAQLLLADLVAEVREDDAHGVDGRLLHLLVRVGRAELAEGGLVDRLHVRLVVEARPGHAEHARDLRLRRSYRQFARTEPIFEEETLLLLLQEEE